MSEVKENDAVSALQDEAERSGDLAPPGDVREEVAGGEEVLRGAAEVAEAGGEPVDDGAEEGGVQDFDRDTWRTPDWLFRWMNLRWGPYELDLFADADNAKCWLYMDKELDALRPDRIWIDRPIDVKHRPDPNALTPSLGRAGALVHSCFGNPPYSKPHLDLVFAMAREQAKLPGANLGWVVPATPENGWWHDHVWRGAEVMSSDSFSEPWKGAPNGRIAGHRTKYDCLGYWLEVIFLRSRVRYLAPDGNGNWTSKRGTPKAGTALIRFTSKLRADPAAPMRPAQVAP